MTESPLPSAPAPAPGSAPGSGPGADRRALRPYLAVLAGLLALRLILPAVRLAEGPALAVNVLLTVVFVALPILALYRAAAYPWSRGLAGAFLGVGVAMHAGGVLASRGIGPGPAGLALEALAQTGLMVWTVGLGALLATSLKDRNLLLPVAIFLAGFDAFLILKPTSLPQQIMQKAPEVFENVAMRVPGVGVSALAFVGPADLFFLGMFFIALHRFGMRARETYRAVVPVLIGYLFVVILFGRLSVAGIPLGALPALVPIGLTVLIVNRDQFHLTKDERAATWVVAALAVGLAAWGFSERRGTPPASPSGPAPSAASPAPPAPEATPAPTPRG